MIRIDDVRKVVDSYLDRHPTEGDRLAGLLESLGAERSLTSRLTFTGHVTCSAVVIDPDSRVLHIRHKALGIWLRPGGHLEPEDINLLGVAVREVEEETGVIGLSALDTLPLDIDIHMIPANIAKGEPEHFHYDMRWLFGIREAPDEISLQLGEVTDYGWLTVDRIQPEELRQKLRKRLS